MVVSPQPSRRGLGLGLGSGLESGLGDKGLAAPRGAVEKKAFRGPYPHPRKGLWFNEG